jgi:hypothetical protein
MSARLSLAALACALAACGSTVDATTTQYVGVPRFPPVEAAAVQILRAEPMQPHDRLGEILLSIEADPPPPIAQVEQRLREEAAQWGASAVFVVRDHVTPYVGRKLIAVAIRYR